MILSPYTKKVEIYVGYRGFYTCGREKVTITIEDNGIGALIDTRSGKPNEKGLLMKISDSFHIYDTTLRDGAQQEGLNLSVHDKLTIARHLDDLGVGFIEGGWPGANPKDTEFFRIAQTELKLKNATFVAFGATRQIGRAHV